MTSRTFSQSSSSSSSSTGPMSLDATSQTHCINDKSQRSTPYAESIFFGALKEKIRSRSRSRSRSRTRTRTRRTDAQSTVVLPPTSMPKDDSQSPPRPRVQRMSSTLSRETTTSSTSTNYKRHSTTSSFYSGRHSNEWLFGGFSVTDTVKDAYHYLREKRE
ncbi:hypothetical protein IWZ03DRAFT_380177 [Phyllosticta citriasiana]|uniref:Uncharacterized protein n=1 Tax=Phyllosticta citriasiana TaxID=595635 RepID=A0ABR1KIY9_9PEZI